MWNDDIFWNIDFRDENIDHIENLIKNLLEKKFEQILSLLKLIIDSFDENNAEIDMVVSFFNGVATDFEFCVENKISAQTHEYLNLSIEETNKNKINLFYFYDLWGDSESEWDTYIISITPDHPNYIADIFISIYQSDKTKLSNIYKMLEKISNKEEKYRCLYELKCAMLNYYSSETIVNDVIKLIPVKK